MEFMCSRSIERKSPFHGLILAFPFVVVAIVVGSGEARAQSSSNFSFICRQSGNPSASFDCTIPIKENWYCGRAYFRPYNHLPPEFPVFDAGNATYPNRSCAIKFAQWRMESWTRYSTYEIPDFPDSKFYVYWYSWDMITGQTAVDIITFDPWRTNPGKDLMAYWRLFSCPAGSSLHALNPSSRVTFNSGYWCQRPLDPAKSPALLGRAQCKGGNAVSPATSNPITIINGNKYLGEVDVGPSTLHGLELSRHYNALGSYRTLNVGANWRLGLDRSLSFETEEMITAYRPDGQQLHLVLSGDHFSPSIGGGDRVYMSVENGVINGWRYEDAERGEVEFYNVEGQLTQIMTVHGQSWMLSRDDGRVVTVSSAHGARVSLAYDARGRLSSLTLPDGGQVVYGYDGQDNLSRVGYPDGSFRVYAYSEPGLTGSNSFPHALTSITDENGIRYVTYAYDSLGRAISETLSSDVGGHALVYNSGNTVVTDPLGSVRTYPYQTVHGIARSKGQTQPSGAGCGASSRTLSYDENGNVSSKTDFAGVETRYAYDLSRNLETQRIEAFGRAESRTTSSAWHPDWPLVSRRAEAQRITTNIYNGQPDPEAGNAPLHCAPAEARILDKPIAVLCKRIEQATDDPDGSQGFAATTLGEARTWRHQYDRHGRLIHSDGPRTDVADITTYDYWPADASCPGAELGSGRDKGCRGQLRQITDALGKITRHTRYNAHGQLEERIAPNGRIDRFAYDARQRLVQERHGEEITAYTYDPAGQLTRLVSPDGSHIDYRYDAAHRLIGLGDDAGNRIDYTLDAAGNRIGEDIRDPGGRLARTVTRAYDALGRLQGIAGAARE